MAKTLANVIALQKQYANKRIDYIGIDTDVNYFNTKEQIARSKIQHFADQGVPSVVVGSTKVTGFFSKKQTVKDDAVYNSSSHATSSTVVDSSGNNRKILALSVDYYASSSVYPYRNGIEITQEKEWIAGLVKISAGTPGHLYEKTLYGCPDTSIVSEDTYYEIEIFDPVKFVETGGDPDLFAYPIITADYNQVENYILNGIIEPFPIRPVISNFSINFPFEPRSVKGNFGNGNINTKFSTDNVVSSDYFTPGVQNAVPYLDAVGVIGLESDTGGVVIGPSFGYFNIDDNRLLPYEDVVYPRGELISSSYDSGMKDVINMMDPLGTTYIDRKSISFSCGFIFNNAPKGTDSIAYGGLLY